jgi:hypothetical protein
MNRKLKAAMLKIAVTAGLCVVSGGYALLAAQQLASPNDVAGSWHYRSFINESKPVPDLNSILFGEGDLILDESSTGALSGTGDFGSGDTMHYQGSVTHGSWVTVRFQGVGTGPKNKDWVYDYIGVVVPRWPNGINQVEAILGSVVRSAPHSNGSGGTVVAGKVASFIAVKK